MDVCIGFLDKYDFSYELQGMYALKFLDMGVAHMLELVSVLEVRVDTVLMKGMSNIERVMEYWLLSPSVALSFCAEIASEEHYFFADKLPDGSIMLNNSAHISFNDLLYFSSCDSFSAVFHYDREVE